MILPLEWTNTLTASRLLAIKQAMPKGTVYHVRIELADQSGRIQGSVIGGGATMRDAIGDARGQLPEALR